MFPLQGCVSGHALTNFSQDSRASGKERGPSFGAAKGTDQVSSAQS